MTATLAVVSNGVNMADGREWHVLNYERVGKRLRAARADMGYESTSSAVAALSLKYRAKVAAGTLGKYERGDTEIPLDFLVAFSLLYEQPITYFLDPAVTGDNAARDYDRLNR